MRLRAKTIDSVLAVAKGVVSDLQELAVAHNNKVCDIHDEIEHMTGVMNMHSDEAERAAKLATKWSELV